MNNDIPDLLLQARDESYADFTRRLLPTVPPDRVIGVRTPALRRLAKSLSGTPTAEAFLQTLPHTYFEENQLHAFLLSRMRDFDACLSGVEAFLPYIDNWATCDQLSPAVFAKNKPALLAAARRWLGRAEPCVVRFGIGMLMRHFLDDDFDPAFPAEVAAVCTEEYYVHMMVAWYFATALAKQYDAVLPYLTERRLDARTHNKAIPKAVESYRITPEQKEALKALRYR